MLAEEFYYTGVLLQIYVLKRVRFCIINVHWQVEDNLGISSILARIDELSRHQMHISLPTHPALIILFQHFYKDDDLS